MNEEILKKGIIDAYLHLRETNNSIPSDVLDWIKDTCLEKVKKCSTPEDNMLTFSVWVYNNWVEGETIEECFYRWKLLQI